MRVSAWNNRWERKPKQRFYHLEAEGGLDRLRAARESDRRILCLLVHGRIVGYAVYTGGTTSPSRSTVTEWLWVAPLERGKGYGARLNAALKRRAWLHGDVQLLTLCPFSRAASGFLLKQGAEPTVFPTENGPVEAYRQLLEESSHWVPILFGIGLVLGTLFGLLLDRLTLCMSAGILIGLFVGGILEHHRSRAVQSLARQTDTPVCSVGRQEECTENRYDAATTSDEAEQIQGSDFGRTWK